MATRTTPTTTSLAGWLTRGIIGGFLAGLAFIGINMWFATTVGKPFRGPLMTVATIAQGPAALMRHTADPGTGFGIHAGLSILFGLIFALLILPWAHLVPRGLVLVSLGIIYGGLLFVVNFYGFAQLFPAFRMPNKAFEFATHLVFGALLALSFLPLPSSDAIRGVAGRRVAPPKRAEAA